MNNPYKPPKSNIVSEEELNRYYPSVFWKLYFWLSIVLFSLLFIMLGLMSLGLIEESAYNLFDGFDMIVWVIALFAIYGLAWSKKTFTRQFWLIFSHGFALWVLIYTFLFPYVLNMPIYGEISQPEDLIYDLSFSFANIYALFRYAYCMDYLWIKNN